jgi:hypothetical protein
LLINLGDVKVKSYEEFINFLKNCQYVYQEEVAYSNDLENSDTDSNLLTAADGTAPPCVYPLRLPPEIEWVECLGIPKARHIPDNRYDEI